MIKVKIGSGEIHSFKKMIESYGYDYEEISDSKPEVIAEVSESEKPSESLPPSL